MSSEKQILANRQNAQLGGLKTPEGKEISKFNALKHGLLSKEVLLKGEDSKSFTELDQNIRENIQPMGEIEILLTERIIANMWRLRRVLEIETAMMEYEKFDDSMADLDLLLSNRSNNTVTEQENQKRRKKIKSMLLRTNIETLIRYETTIERSIYQALHELQRLQAARMGIIKSPLPIAVDITLDRNNDGDRNEE